MKFRHILAIFCSMLSLGESANAAVLFQIAADRLDDAGGNPIATTSLVLLIADTAGDGFGTFYAGGINLWDAIDGAGGDDRIIFRSDLSTYDGITPGVLLNITNESETALGLTFANGWNQGDPLGLIWFPTLDLGDTSVAAGTAFGSFLAGNLPVNIKNGSDPWETPPDNEDSHELYFITGDGTTILSSGGGHDATAGDATHTVQAVPEPSTSLLLAISGMALFGFGRRRSR